MKLKWIHIKDKTPQDGEYVLVLELGPGVSPPRADTSCLRDSIRIGWYEGDPNGFEEIGGDGIYSEYWMPIPQEMKRDKWPYTESWIRRNKVFCHFWERCRDKAVQYGYHEDSYRGFCDFHRAVLSDEGG